METELNSRPHAYLIYAHNNFKVLKLLLSCIDDSRNDIYLHIDAKVSLDNSLRNSLQSTVHLSKLHILETRIDVKWGTYLQIEVELALFKEAASSKPYSYYHLLSGVDMPLRSQDEIHNFFSANSGKEFLTFAPENREQRVRYIRPLPITRGEGIKGLIYRSINRVAVFLQKAVGYNHFYKRGVTIKKGSNWCSLSHEAVGYLLTTMEQDITLYHRAHCPDEFYKQTTLYNSPIKERLSPLGNMRFIDWQRGKGASPYTFRGEDFEELMSRNNCLFARKFDEGIDLKIVKIITHEIKTRNQ